MSQATSGRLVVATPALRDGVFDQAVVYMLHHDPVGALGVIINQPGELTTTALLPRWAELTGDDAVIRTGGPVSPDGFIGMARRIGADTTYGVGTPSVTRACSIDLDGDPAIAAAHVDALVIFRGYAGWGPGQLDAELSEGAWFAVDAEPDDLWGDEASLDSLFEQVLRRQPGTVRWFANAPEDPSHN